MKRHCALRLLLQWLGPAGSERARPISAFWPSINRGDSCSLPPFTGAAPLDNSGRPMVTRRTWWCQRGTLHQGEPVGGGRVEGGSPQTSSGGEGRRRWVDGYEAISGEGVTWSNYRVEWFFLKWWRGQRCLDSGGQR
jgi:hypothetical protein